MPVYWAIAIALLGWAVASVVPDDRRVIVGSAVLTVAEVSIVAAAATVFASFSSPFLTAVLTFGIFLIGRSAETLANMPERFLGPEFRAFMAGISRVVPNLMIYVPPRPLLIGAQAGPELVTYLVTASAHAVAWSAVLLAFASLIFRRRDFL